MQSSTLTSVCAILEQLAAIPFDGLDEPFHLTHHRTLEERYLASWHRPTGFPAYQSRTTWLSLRAGLHTVARP